MGSWEKAWSRLCGQPWVSSRILCARVCAAADVLIQSLSLTSIASERLSEAETSAASDQHHAQHNSHAPNAFRSEIYNAGAEYALCQAIAQLMMAVVGVMNESLTESIKAFYRLRKAYIALDAILKMEEKFMELREPSQLVLADTTDPKSDTSSQTSARKGATTTGQIASSDLPQKMSDLAVSNESSDVSTRESSPGPANLTHDPDSGIFKNEIDVFVHSGANFCFGILLLLISMVPPAFSKLLSIIGFHGDKQRGLRMLWQASKFHNLIGAIAALALLAYYNGFVRYCDIMPDPAPGEEDVEGYPQERLAALLAEMRARFPNSQLWLLEESRMKGANKDLDGALELLASNKKSPLKQVEALRVFEKSLNALFLHKFELCSEAFLEVRIACSRGPNDNQDADPPLPVCGTQFLVSRLVLLHCRILPCRPLPRIQVRP